MIASVGSSQEIRIRREKKEYLPLQFLGPLILTAAPMIFVPLLSVRDAAPKPRGGIDGWAASATPITVTFPMAPYTAVLALIGLFLKQRKTNHSSLGVSSSIAAGAILGMFSCTTSQAVFL